MFAFFAFFSNKPLNHLKREIFLHLRFNADDCFSLFVGINLKSTKQRTLLRNPRPTCMIKSDHVGKRKVLAKVCSIMNASVA